MLSQRKDVAFYLKMFPLVKIHPDAYRKSKAIVCEQKISNEKALKLLEDAYAKKEIPDPTCETDVVDKNIALGQRLGFSGTPTMIMPNGRIVSGAMDADRLLKTIEENSTGPKQEAEEKKE